MRISDWSSDVCSSDLRFRLAALYPGAASVMSTGGRMGRTKTLALGLALMMLPAAAFAQEAAPAAPAPAEAVAADAGASAPAPAVVELKPTQGIGMPVPEAIEIQAPFTNVGKQARVRSAN